MLRYNLDYYFKVKKICFKLTNRPYFNTTANYFINLAAQYFKTFPLRKKIAHYNVQNY